MIDHYEEEQYLADVIIYRYWLHWEDYETNTGATIAYFEAKQEGRGALKKIRTYITILKI